MNPQWKVLIGGKPVQLKVLKTDAERGAGYQHHLHSPSLSEGLLFLFSDELGRTFHMRNVSFDLDLIGFNTDGEMVCIIPMKANNQQKYFTPPCKFVVEVAKGFSDDLPENCSIKLL